MGSRNFSWNAMLPAARQYEAKSSNRQAPGEASEVEPQDNDLIELDEAGEPQTGADAVIRVVSFYHSITGVFHPRHVMSSDPETIAANTPPEHVAIDGDHFDPFTQKVDVKTGQIVDQLPPAPSPDHEWSSASRRWQLKADVVARQRAHRDALARIRQLEVKGMRALREHALGKPGAKHRLQSIDQQIAQLRQLLAPEDDPS
jgi:hypothetical protein